MMTLGQFALAVGATPRWVLNALTRLRVRRRYDESLARRLAMARTLSDAFEIPLIEAFGLAGKALKQTDPFGCWRHAAPDGAAALIVDMPRFFAGYLPRLALAMSAYGEKQRGRRTSRRRSAIARAREYGVDTTLLAAQLNRTPSQRLSDLDANLEFLRGVKLTP